MTPAGGREEEGGAEGRTEAQLGAREQLSGAAASWQRTHADEHGGGGDAVFRVEPEGRGQQLLDGHLPGVAGVGRCTEVGAASGNLAQASHERRRAAHSLSRATPLAAPQRAAERT